MNDEVTERQQKEDKAKDWIANALTSMTEWFPVLPTTVKVIFASALIYLVLCFLSQTDPKWLFVSTKDAVTDWVAYSRTRQETLEERALAERRDIIELLIEQNRELKSSSGSNPELNDRVRVLELKMAVMMSGHPADRAKYESMIAKPIVQLD